MENILAHSGIAFVILVILGLGLAVFTHINKSYKPLPHEVREFKECQKLSVGEGDKRLEFTIIDLNGAEYYAEALASKGKTIT